MLVVRRCRVARAVATTSAALTVAVLPSSHRSEVTAAVVPARATVALLVAVAVLLPMGMTMVAATSAWSMRLVLMELIATVLVCGRTMPHRVPVPYPWTAAAATWTAVPTCGALARPVRVRTACVPW